MEIPSELLNSIKQNKLVIFVGAGTSIKLGLPNWINLVSTIIEKLSSDYSELIPVKELLESNTLSPLQALGVLEDKKLKRETLKIISDILKLDNKKNYSIHKKIFELSTRIITTNYDKAFEFATNFQLNIVNPDSKFKLSTLSDSENYLFKIHGDIDSPDACILFEHQYIERYVKGENAFLLELQKIFTSQTLLFVGFGFKDPFINKIFEKLDDLYNEFGRKYYVLTTDSRFLATYGAMPLLIDSYDKLEGKLDDYLKLKNSEEYPYQIKVESTAIDSNAIPLNNTLSQLAELYSIEENKLNSNSTKEDFETIERIKRELSKRIFDDFDKSVIISSTLKGHYKNTLFDQIYNSDILDKHTILKIDSIREKKHYEWQDRALVVSALSLSLLQHKKFDAKKANILIDFITDFEEGVWERALVGLTLALIINVNKWQKYDELKKRINTLQNIEKVQSGLDLIEFILIKKLYKQSLFNNSIYENDFFKNNISNCFQPFYKDNPIIEKLREDAPSTFDVDTFQNWLLAQPLCDNIKYVLCLDNPYNKNGDEIPRHIMYSYYSKLGIANHFNPFFAYICDYYHFINWHPKEHINNFFNHHISLASTTRLKSLILNSQMQLKVTGDDYYNKNEFTDAIQTYERLLNIDPNNAVVLWNTAYSYESLNKFSTAIQYRKKLAVVNPLNYENIQQLGKDYEQIRDFAMAMQTYTSIHTAKPNWLTNIAMITSCHIHQDNIAEAEIFFRQQGELNPKTYEDYIALSDIYTDFYQDYKSIECLQECITIKPKSVGIYLQLIMNYTNINDEVNAKKNLEIAIELDKDGKNKYSIQFYRGLINLVFDLNLEEFYRLYSKIKEKNKGYEFYCNMAHYHYFLGRKNEALQLYNKCINEFNIPNYFLYRFKKEKLIFHKYGYDDDSFMALYEELCLLAPVK